MNEVTEKVIGCAIEVHKHLGPGLLESAYEECTCYEMVETGLGVRRQVPLPVVYKGIKLDCGYRCSSGGCRPVHLSCGTEGWAADKFSCSRSQRRSQEANELIDSPCLCVSVVLFVDEPAM